MQSSETTRFDKEQTLAKKCSLGHFPVVPAFPAFPMFPTATACVFCLATVTSAAGAVGAVSVFFLSVKLCLIPPTTWSGLLNLPCSLSHCPKTGDWSLFQTRCLSTHRIINSGSAFAEGGDKAPCKALSVSRQYDTIGVAG